MNYEQDRAWAEVSLTNLADNFRTLAALVGPGCRPLCVVKGNAYGHGAVAVSRELERAGCTMLGVATVEEAMELREHGIRTSVLILGPISPAHAALAADQGLLVPLTGLAQAEALSAAATAAGKVLEGHLKLDTGMSRYGLPVTGDLEGRVAEALAIARLPGLSVTGVFTHFAVAGDPAEDAFTARQLALFQRFSQRMEEEGLRLTRHCANSPATLRFPQARFDMVRVGTILYGFNLYGVVDLKPVMELKTRVVELKHLRPGDTVGYGRLFTCQRPTVAAIVPFGFVDGIHRAASNRGTMLVNGRPARIIGKICMDLCFLDVTDIPGVELGQEVTVFGRDHGTYQSAYALTDCYPGSAPELAAVLGSRIPRFYLRDGEIVGRD